MTGMRKWPDTSQLQPGTVEHALSHLIDPELALSHFGAHYRGKQMHYGTIGQSSIMIHRPQATPRDAVNAAGQPTAAVSDWHLGDAEIHVGTGQRNPTSDSGYQSRGALAAGDSASTPNISCCEQVKREHGISSLTSAAASPRLSSAVLGLTNLQRVAPRRPAPRDTPGSPLLAVLLPRFG